MATRYKPPEDQVETSIGRFVLRTLVTLDALASRGCALVRARSDEPRRGRIEAWALDGSGEVCLDGLIVAEATFEDAVNRKLVDEPRGQGLADLHADLGCPDPPDGDLGSWFNPFLRIAVPNDKARFVLGEVGPMVAKVARDLAAAPDRFVVVGRHDPKDGGPAVGAGCLARLLCWRGEDTIEVEVVETVPGGPRRALSRTTKAGTFVQRAHVVLWDASDGEWDALRRLEAERQAALERAQERHGERVAASAAVMGRDGDAADAEWSEGFERAMGMKPERFDPPRRPRVLPDLSAGGADVDGAEAAE